MAYSTEDLILKFLSRLDDEIERGLEVPQLDIPALIVKADQIVDQYIGQKYQVPLPNPLPIALGIIETISTMLAAKFVWESWYAETQAKDSPKPMDTYWKWAIKILENISTGKAGYALYTGPNGAVIPTSNTGRSPMLNSITESDLRLSRTILNTDTVLSGDY